MGAQRIVMQRGRARMLQKPAASESKTSQNGSYGDQMGIGDE